MKLFLSIKDTFKTIGIRQPQSFVEFNRFNLGNSIVLGGLIYFSVTTYIHLIYEADSLIDHIETVFNLLTSLHGVGLNTSIILQTKSLYTFFNNVDDFVQKRKFLF